MSTSSLSGRHRFALARWRRVLPNALLALLLACFVIQGTAVQSHVHFVGRSSGELSLTAPQAARTATPYNDDAATCPLCQEAATAGAYLLPAVAAVPPAPAPVLWVSAAAIAAFALLTPARGWRSRAPPQHLHTDR